MRKTSPLYDILPKRYNRDTVEIAKKIIVSIKTDLDYETVLLKCIDYSNDVILETVIKTLGKRDLEYCKEELVNFSLTRGDKKIIELICGFFDVAVDLHETISQLKYVNGKIINTYTDIDYLTNLDNVEDFEEIVTEMHVVHEAGETKKYDELFDLFKFTLNEEQKEKVKKFAQEYHHFFENEFKKIIKNISEKPDSETDCWGILYSCLDRVPSRWECDVFWDESSYSD